MQGPWPLNKFLKLLYCGFSVWLDGPGPMDVAPHVAMTGVLHIAFASRFILELGIG